MPPDKPDDGRTLPWRFPGQTGSAHAMVPN